MDLTKDSRNKVIIVGDFNHFKVDRLCSDLDLTDLVHRPTCANHILDHVLISKDFSDCYTSSSVTYNPPIGKADHKTLIVTPLKNQSRYTAARNRTVCDFRRSNINNLLQKASETDWMSVWDTEDVEGMWALNVVLQNIVLASHKHSC